MNQSQPTFEIDRGGLLTVDVQTEKRGNSSAIVCREEDTEVSYGGLHAKVMLLDLNIRVVMNPDEGDWKSADWARARALEVLSRSCVKVLSQYAKARRAQGYREGVNDARRQMRAALGIDDLGSS